ncbi:MAG TPA: AraC family transcriptional regulator [Polyangiales bacterium]|nr:AraC family transcriptional regulator [Polyangiales bacterium]
MLIRDTTFRGLCRARDMLHDLSEPTSIARLASQARVSPFHFIRQFEAVFGTTPHQLRIEARIQRAKDLLLHDRSVTEVCMDVGFSSLGSFSSSFARRVGVSPSDYRRQAKRVVQVRAQLLAPGCLSLLAFLPAEAFRNFEEAAAAQSMQDAGI